MSTLQGGQIADPVHKYVYFTSIERIILDRRVAQRLRWVAQNGLNHMVYPEVRTSRFSHSFGTMHLASRFLAASIANADADSQVNIAKRITELIERVIEKDRGRSGRTPQGSGPLLGTRK